LVRHVGVMLDPGLGIFGAIERTCRENRIGAWRRETEEHRHVDFAAINGERQRTAKADVLQDIAPDRILVIEIGEEGDTRSLRALPKIDLDGVILLGLLQECIVVELDRGALQIALDSAGLGRNERRRADVELEAVEIRELTAVLIDAMLVGIALKDDELGG